MLLTAAAAKAQMVPIGAVGQGEAGASSEPVYYFAGMDSAGLAVDRETHPDGAAQWSMFDDAAGAYVDLTAADTVTVAAEGRYRLTLTAAGTTAEWTCLCFAPQVTVDVARLDSVNCTNAYLLAQATAASPTYVDPVSGIEQTIGLTLGYEWTVADTLTIASADGRATAPSPTDSVLCIVRATSSAGTWAEDTVRLSAYAVSADFDYEVRGRDVPHEVSMEGAWSAPVEVELTQKARGSITAYEWMMGDAARLYEKNPVYTFQKSGTYSLTLTVTDERSGCSATSEAKSLTVTDSFVGFPTAFTPNGDGVNDEFRPSYRSLKSYHLVIMSRWGRVVYETHDPQTGWDGQTSAGKAPEGTYFYVAKASGYDPGVSFSLKGSLTLIR